MRSGAVKGSRFQAPYVATARDRAQVLHLAGFQLKPKEIAMLLQISLATLNRHFRVEMTTGPSHLAGEISGKILALSRKAKDERVQLDASKWLSARRLGWAETVKNEVTGANGGAIKAQTKLVYSGILADADKGV